MTTWHRNAVEARLLASGFRRATRWPDQDWWQDEDGTVFDLTCSVLEDGCIPEHEHPGYGDSHYWSDHWQLNPVVDKPDVLVHPDRPGWLPSLEEADDG